MWKGTAVLLVSMSRHLGMQTVKMVAGVKRSLHRSYEMIVLHNTSIPSETSFE
jgi:hypothetical protein